MFPEAVVLANGVLRPFGFYGLYMLAVNGKTQAVLYVAVRGGSIHFAPPGTSQNT